MAADRDVRDEPSRLERAPARALVRRGTDRFTAPPAVRDSIPGGPVSLNLVDVPIAVAAKAVFADTFGWNYAIDERVRGTVTLQTQERVSREVMLDLFESALASRGFTIRRQGGSVLVAPVANAEAGGNPVREPRGTTNEADGAYTVPLRWIAAAEMQAILVSVLPKEVVLRTDTKRNLLILSGEQAALRAARATVATFDVDWMRGMSTAVVPVRTGNPSAIVRDLDRVFFTEQGAERSLVRFLPNDQAGAIMVVTPRAAYLDRAREWIENLVSLAADRERQLFVYRLQNRSARDVAGVLQGVIASEFGMSTGTIASLPAGQGGLGGLGGRSGAALAPALGGGQAGGPGGGLGGFGGSGASAGGGSTFGGGNGASAYGGASASPAGAYGAGGAPPAGGAAGPGGLGGASPASYGGPASYGAGPAGYGGDPIGFGDGMQDSGSGGARREMPVGVVADEANNSLVISATRNQYDKIVGILARLDAMPTQVLLETVIAEVTLNDSLEFGVQWFLKNGKSGFNLTQAATVGALAATTGGTAALAAAAGRGTPGFNYLLGNTDFNVIINALRGVTRVNVISSPNITVLDNRTARLQVGDQVPIVRQSGQSALAANAPVLNEIELKDTGVILSVTPRVNKNGLVTLDINQEVSDVVPTTTSNINSPTIRQRKVATSVVVRDNHSLAIGGMVQEKGTVSNEAVPVLGELPILGPAFRNRVDNRVRTELLVFIRPKVMRSTAEADRVTADFQSQFRAMMPIRPVPPMPPMQTYEANMQGQLRRTFE